MGKIKPEKTFFELPGSSIKGIPLEACGEKLVIGLVEIGRKPDGKRLQLKDKRELMRTYWKECYILEKGISWYPLITRTLIHYDTHSFQKGVFDRLKVYNPDVVMYCSSISKESLERMGYEQKIMLACSSEPEKASGLEKLLLENDSEKLQHILVSKGRDLSYSNFRGRLAEVIALDEIERCLTGGMSLYRNEDVRFFRERLKNGTEVDGILLLYGEKRYWMLIGALKQSPLLNVEVNWDIVRKEKK